MRSGSRLTAFVVGGLVLLCTVTANAQLAPQPHPVTHVASLAPGSIYGVVQDERGLPVAGAVISALGTTTSTATSDRAGRFELRTLTPGPYLVRAHLSGYVGSRGQVIEVRSSARTASAISIRRSASTLLTAGLTAPSDPIPVLAQPDPGDTATAGSTGPDNHGEVAWHLRHTRRGILKDRDVPDDIYVPDAPNYIDPSPTSGGVLGLAFGSSARFASNLFAGTAFSGQVNLLTTGSFETPQQLFTTDNFSRSITYLTLGAPVGTRGDWTVRAALTQGDLASWIVAGDYSTRAPARHRYELGWSYSAQRYDGGNFAALREVTDGSRNAGAIFVYDTFSVTPSMTIAYGGRYASYGYLDDRTLFSPRMAVTVEPFDHFRVSGVVSHRSVAPGAEEFMPRMESAVWLPPQRTFASIDPSRALHAERTDHLELEVERDVTVATVTMRAFRQRISDQLVTVFGVDMPQVASHVGHYFIGNAGDIEASGIGAGLRASFGGRVHGSVEYSTMRAEATGAPEHSYLWVVAPSAIRTEPDRIHDISTSVETEVPETSTRVLVLYRVSNGFARPGPATSNDRALDARFDVQVRQSLPFMDFSAAKWEMLIGVRNFFRETAPDQSIYDELLVVRPPKRVVGGLTLKF